MRARNSETVRSSLPIRNGGAPTANQSAATISGTNTSFGSCGANASTIAINSDANTTTSPSELRTAVSGDTPAAANQISSTSDTAPSAANAMR